jgi:hypothetical protein
MTFIPWPEIESFHHIRKFIRVDPGEWWAAREKLCGSSVVTYKPKVKLHGTNAAVLRFGGKVMAQSRSGIITPENDNAGFARWVETNKSAWSNNENFLPCAIFYGEWVGKGIQKGVAVSEIDKCFAVFAARLLNIDGDLLGDDLIIEPEQLAAHVGNVPNTYILPWYGTTLDVDWRHSDDALTQTIAPVNDWVSAVENNDPWVEATFGVKGTGEGLVFYPVSKPHLGFENFNYLVFKAKGEKHKNIATAKPAQVNAESAASIDAFCSLVLTPARLEQGATAVGGFDLKLTGQFLTWIAGDIQKECQDELAASNLTWKQVQKPLGDKARTWFVSESKIR